MTKELQQQQERIRELLEEALAKGRSGSRATYAASETYKALETNIRKAVGAGDGAQYRAESLAKDDTMNREGRDRLIREAYANGEAQRSKYARAADAAATIYKAQLAVAALPRVDPTREALLQGELNMLVTASNDPVHVELQIVMDPDNELAAVAASRYGESLLRAKGIPNAAQAAQSVRTVAAQVAVNSADPERRAAGQTLAGISALDDALVCTGSITRTSLETAKSAALAAGVTLPHD